MQGICANPGPCAGWDNWAIVSSPGEIFLLYSLLFFSIYLGFALLGLLTVLLLRTPSKSYISLYLNANVTKFLLASPLPPAETILFPHMHVGKILVLLLRLDRVQCTGLLLPINALRRQGIPSGRIEYKAKSCESLRYSSAHVSCSYHCKAVLYFHYLCGALRIIIFFFLRLL